MSQYIKAISIQQLLFLQKNHQKKKIRGKKPMPELPRGIHHQHLDNEILCLAGEMTSEVASLGVAETAGRMLQCKSWRIVTETRP